MWLGCWTIKSRIYWKQIYFSCCISSNVWLTWSKVKLICRATYYCIVHRSYYATKEARKCVTAASEHAACYDTSVLRGWVLPPTTLWRVMHHYPLPTSDWLVYAFLEPQGNSADMKAVVFLSLEIFRYLWVSCGWNEKQKAYFHFRNMEDHDMAEGSYPAVETWPSRGPSERNGSCKVPAPSI